MKLIDIHFSKDKVYYTKNNNSRVVVAIGNFDGLHIGHEKLLNVAKKVKKCYVYKDLASQSA